LLLSTARFRFNITLEGMHRPAFELGQVNAAERAVRQTGGERVSVHGR
jgi:hypothetical protein